MPAHAGALTLLPVRHTGSDPIDHADYLVPRHTRIRDTGKEAFLGDYVAVAHSTCLNANPHLSRAGLRDFSFDDFEIPSRFGNLHSVHC